MLKSHSDTFSFFSTCGPWTRGYDWWVVLKLILMSLNTNISNFMLLWRHSRFLWNVTLKPRTINVTWSPFHVRYTRWYANCQTIARTLTPVRFIFRFKYSRPWGPSDPLRTNDSNLRLHPTLNWTETFNRLRRVKNVDLWPIKMTTLFVSDYLNISVITRIVDFSLLKSWPTASEREISTRGIEFTASSFSATEAP